MFQRQNSRTSLIIEETLLPFKYLRKTIVSNYGKTEPVTEILNSSIKSDDNFDTLTLWLFQITNVIKLVISNNGIGLVRKVKRF